MLGLPSALLFVTMPIAAQALQSHAFGPDQLDLGALKARVVASPAFQKKMKLVCTGKWLKNFCSAHDDGCDDRRKGECESRVAESMFCGLLRRTRPQDAKVRCQYDILNGDIQANATNTTELFIEVGKEVLSHIDQLKANVTDLRAAVGGQFLRNATKSKFNATAFRVTAGARFIAPTKMAKATAPTAGNAAAPNLSGPMAAIKANVTASVLFKQATSRLTVMVGCYGVKKAKACEDYVQDAAFCLVFAEQLKHFKGMPGEKEEKRHCTHLDSHLPALSLLLQQHAGQPVPRIRLLQLHLVSRASPEEDLATEMAHDLEMNFNKIAPFGKEDTAMELQDHAGKTQDTLVDALENAEVAEIKRAVFRALTRLRAATIKEFDTIARLETQAIDAYNDAHHYRYENPLQHLHEDEAPVETDKLKSLHGGVGSDGFESASTVSSSDGSFSSRGTSSSDGSFSRGRNSGALRGGTVHIVPEDGTGGAVSDAADGAQANIAGVATTTAAGMPMNAGASAGAAPAPAQAIVHSSYHDIAKGHVAKTKYRNGETPVGQEPPAGHR